MLWPRAPAQPPAASAGGPMTRRRMVELLRPPPLDYIGTLPDELLGEIISLLPAKDGGRTQVLASRWRHIWRPTPFNLDCHKDSVDISGILEAHPGPGRSFRVPRIDPAADDVDAWLRSAALNNLHELELRGYFLHPLPPSIFCYARTLRAVTLAGCMLRHGVAFQGLHFPQLKMLGLERVVIPEPWLQMLVDGCPALEFLLVYVITGFRRLRINSLTLKSICVRINTSHKLPDEPHSEELIVENAPCLERLIHLYAIRDLDVSVFSTPKVDIPSDWHNFYTGLVSCSSVIQKLPIDGPTNAVHAVKSLAVDMNYLSMDDVVELLRLFPCLENLHVKSREWRESNCWHRKHRNLHDIHLKTVVLEPYLGNMPHVNFAKFFVLNARVLQLMTFHIEAKFNNKKFLAKQRHKLELDNKASRDAQFRFTTGSCQHGAWNTKQLRDLGLNDPFVCGC